MNAEPTPGAKPTPLYAPLAAGATRLRVAVLVDRDTVPAWIGETLREIAASEATTLAAIVVVAAPAPPPLPWALRTFLRLDAMLSRSARVATAPQPIGSRWPEIALLRVAGDDRAGELVLDAGDLAKLRALGADLLIGFGLPRASAPLMAIASRGAWFFERRATDPEACGLHFLDPIWRGEAITPSGVVVYANAARVAERLGVSWNATALLSFSRNRAYQLLRIPAELVRVLRKLAENRPIEKEDVADGVPPHAVAVLGFMLRLVARAFRRHLPRIGKSESWVLGARRSHAPLDPAHAQDAKFEVLSAPPGLFWADPFVVSDAGRDFVFVEECPLGGRGRIAVLEVNPSLKVSNVRTVLEPPWHLSYPVVFDWKGQRLMLVESSEIFTLTLYRCMEFPLRWEPIRHLFEGRNVVDATPHYDGGRWYLFVTVSESPLGYDKRFWTDLFIFWATDPEGPWHPHALNPVLSDVRRARPAGAFFERDGRLIRPAQDCSTDYGRAIVFHEVVRLDPDHYEERPIGRLDPDWAPGLRGCHTYASSGTLEVVDGKILVSRSKAASPQKEPADGR